MEEVTGLGGGGDEGEGGGRVAGVSGVGWRKITKL